MQRLPAEMRMRQDEQLLREALLRRTRRKDRVGEKVIHGGQPRRGEVANPRNLHGRGTTGENRQRSARRMPRKIDKDVDAVPMDRLRCFLGRKAHEIADVPHRFAHMRRIGILLIQRIDRHIEARGVERRHQGIRKRKDDVLPNIGREIADGETILPKRMPCV